MQSPQSPDEHKAEFLKEVSKYSSKYMSVKPSSAESERLFSTVGNIYRILPIQPPGG